MSDEMRAGRSQTSVAKVYRDTLEVCLKYPNFISFETWGVSDAYSWLRLWPPVNLTNAQPVLFDENYQRKDAYYAVIEALRGKLIKNNEKADRLP